MPIQFRTPGTLGTAFFAGLLALLAVKPLLAQSSDAGRQWPQWRGADFSSVASTRGLPLEFGPDRNCLWKAAMPGRAGSSPVVWDDRVYVTSVSADGNGLVLIAVDSDGSELWSSPLPGGNRDFRDEANSAAPSPMTDGKHVWATSSNGGLACFDMSGREIWTVDLQKEYGRFDIQFGLSSTPLLFEGRLYLQLIHGSMRSEEPGTGIVLCLDAGSGKQVWKQNRETQATYENKHSYASPSIYDDGKLRFLVAHGGDCVTGHAIADGRELWRCRGLNNPANYNPYLRFVASPTCVPGMIVVPSAKNGPVIALRPDGSGDITDQPAARHWTLERGTPDVASPVVHDGLVFLFRENGVVICLDATSGEEIWNERLLADKHRSTPVVADGHLFVPGRDGVVTVLKAGREAEVVSSNALSDTVTASPAVANGRIYIRTFSTLWCFGQPAEN